MNNYPFIDTSAFISIIAWKLTKNCSHINSDISIPGCSPYCGNSQRFNLDVESPNMQVRGIELLYCLIGKLLCTKKYCIRHTSMCYMHTHKDRIINKLSQRQALDIDILIKKKI